MFVEKEELIFEFDEDIKVCDDANEKKDTCTNHIAIPKMPIDNIREIYKKPSSSRHMKLVPQKPKKIIIGFFPYYVC